MPPSRRTAQPRPPPAPPARLRGGGVITVLEMPRWRHRRQRGFARITCQGCNHGAQEDCEQRSSVSENATTNTNTEHDHQLSSFILGGLHNRCGYNGWGASRRGPTLFSSLSFATRSAFCRFLNSLRIQRPPCMRCSILAANAGCMNDTHPSTPFAHRLAPLISEAFTPLLRQHPAVCCHHR